MNDDIHLVQLFAIRRIGQQQLRHLQHVARGGDLVRVLARRVDDRRFHGRLLGLRPVRRLDRRHEVHGPDLFAEIALPDLVDGRFFRFRHLRENAVRLGRRDRRVPLKVGRGVLLDIRERRRSAGFDRRDDIGGLGFVFPADRHAQTSEVVIRERVAIKTGLAQAIEIGERRAHLLG
jgi:hypothetical protein